MVAQWLAHACEANWTLENFQFKADRPGCHSGRHQLTPRDLELGNKQLRKMNK